MATRMVLAGLVLIASGFATLVGLIVVLIYWAAIVGYQYVNWPGYVVVAAMSQMILGALVALIARVRT